MKKLFLLFSIFYFLFSFSSKAQSEKFIASMTSNVAMLDTASNSTTIQTVCNSLERVAEKEKTEWLPYYYIAYCNVLLSYGDKKKIDDYCDKADSALMKIDSLNYDSSEVNTMRAWINSSRIMVNPMSRGQKYGTIAANFISLAEKQNPNNPRPFLLSAQQYYYTPKQFGGGKDKALPIAQQAVDKYASFTPKAVYFPHWGSDEATKLLAKCKE